jgi:hypothetical protein
METTMDNDDLKAAWQDLSRRIESQNALNMELLRDRKLEKMRRSLLPLVIGQVLQIALGVGLVVLGVVCWKRNLHVASYLVAGIVVHAFGIATAALAGITLGLIATLDYAAPVVKIQKQLGALRRFYAFNGGIAGVSWWVMWMVVVVAFAGLGHHAVDAAWAWWTLGVGIAGLLATWGAWWWAQRHPQRRFAAWVNSTAVGASLRTAQARLDEVRGFER